MVAKREAMGQTNPLIKSGKKEHAGFIIARKDAEMEGVVNSFMRKEEHQTTREFIEWRRDITVKLQNADSSTR